MQRKLIFIIMALICSLLLFGCKSETAETTPPDAEIRVWPDGYKYDVDSFPVLAANADYIIVGKVIEELNTFYRESYAFTNYSVNVVQNLKGELTQEIPITICKEGGITRDGSQCLMHRDDILPVADGTYIFFITVSIQHDYNLSSEPNSTIPLDEKALNTKYTTRTSSTFDTLPSETKIKEIVDAINMNLSVGAGHNISKDDVTRIEQAQCEELSIIENKLPIDHSNLNELSGAADYICIAEVVKVFQLQGDYGPQASVKQKNGNLKEANIPLTYCLVRINQNLKGELVQGEDILITKYGGYSAEQGEYMLFDNDILPEEGRKYIWFIHVAQSGMEAQAYGPNSTIPFGNRESTTMSTRHTSIDNLTSDQKTAKIKDAIEHQIPAESERTLSVHDKSYYQ